MLPSSEAYASLPTPSHYVTCSRSARIIFALADADHCVTLTILRFLPGHTLTFSVLGCTPIANTFAHEPSSTLRAHTSPCSSSFSSCIWFSPASHISMSLLLLSGGTLVVYGWHRCGGTGGTGGTLVRDHDQDTTKTRPSGRATQRHPSERSAERVGSISGWHRPSGISHSFGCLEAGSASQGFSVEAWRRPPATWFRFIVAIRRRPTAFRVLRLPSGPFVVPLHRLRPTGVRTDESLDVQSLLIKSMGNLFSHEPRGTVDKSFDTHSNTVPQSATTNLKRPQSADLSTTTEHLRSTIPVGNLSTSTF